MPFIPSSVNTGNLKAYPQIAYDKLVVENWKANTPALNSQICAAWRSARDAPTNTSVTSPSGRHQDPAEGQTGQGLPLNQTTARTYLDQFVDYHLILGHGAESTFISPIVAEGAAELAYRGALTVNTICTTQFDASTTIDSKIIIDLGDNEFLTSSIIRRCEMSLDAVNVPRRATESRAAWDIRSCSTT